MSELKPCPYCNGKALACRAGANQGYYILCTTCECRTAVRVTKALAAEDWNSRAQPDNAPLTLEALRGMDGDKVWLDDTKNSVNSGWHLANTKKGFLVDMHGWKIPISCLGDGRTAYRRKPETKEATADAQR